MLNPKIIPNYRTRSEIEKNYGYMVNIDRKSLGYDKRRVRLVAGRLYKGWTIGDAMNTPKGKHGGDRRSKYDWRDCTVTRNCVYQRIKKGRRFEDAISVPKFGKNPLQS